MTELTDGTATSEEAPTDGEETVAQEEQTERVQKDEEQTSTENLTRADTSTARSSCLTIQPNRVQCGVRTRHKGINYYINNHIMFFFFFY